MLRLIRRWREDRRRLLFRFYDGRRHRRADPLAVSASLAEHPEYLPRHLDEAMVGDRDAIRICADAASSAFSVDDASRGGLTIAERLELLVKFETWIDALKKNMTRLPA